MLTKGPDIIDINSSDTRSDALSFTCRATRIVTATLLTLIFLYGVMVIAQDSRKSQWDFFACYYAAYAALSGQNPYDLFTLTETAGRRVMEFFYQPISLLFFAPFTMVGYNTAALIFLVIKCCLLAWLMFLWTHKFLDEPSMPLFILFCLLAYNSTIYLDLRAGNVSLLEQAALWTAFLFFVQRRLVGFCVFVIIASLFKMTPILFLFLLLFVRDDHERKGWFPILGAFGVLGALMAIQAIVVPNLFNSFVHGLADVANRSVDTGIVNPVLPLLIRDGFGAWAQTTGWEIPEVGRTIFTWAVRLSIFIVGVLQLRTIAVTQIKDKEKLMVFFACLLYALLLPRFKDYSYILLLVPTYFAVTRLSVSTGMILAYILAIVSGGYVTLPGYKAVMTLWWTYYPLVLALGTWILYVLYIRAIAKNRSARKEDSVSTNSPVT